METLYYLVPLIIALISLIIGYFTKNKTVKAIAITIGIIATLIGIVIMYANGENQNVVFLA